MTEDRATPIPTRFIGPVHLCFRGDAACEKIEVPLATYETTLWPSAQRGAKVSATVERGIQVVVIDDCMTRSIALEAPGALEAAAFVSALDDGDMRERLAQEVTRHSRFTRLRDIRCRIVGCLIYLRLSFSVGDAAGHNMATLAAQNIQHCLLERFSQLRYVSVSGNYCVDKKNSGVNAVLGRGKYVVADITIPKLVCEKLLKTTPQTIADLNVKKNLLGSVAAGSVHSANAHFANLLLAFYLATGQDAANIVEGSQGITHAQTIGEDLYFSVTLPNIIVGTVGHGKSLPHVQDNLRRLGCLEQRESGDNARRLAMIVAATVLCGELSLLAALTQPQELMRAHQIFERRQRSSRA